MHKHPFKPSFWSDSLGFLYIAMVSTVFITSTPTDPTKPIAMLGSLGILRSKVLPKYFLRIHYRGSLFNAYRAISISPIRASSFPEPPIVHTQPPSEKAEKQPKFPLAELEAARAARLANLGWLEKLPLSWIPYAELMRLEKPVGTFLLLIPSLWGITMAAYGISASLATTSSAIALFSVGALVMRGAGCTINDILDRNLDNQVARTVERPIASGRVSVPKAVTFLAAQCFVGLGVLLSLPFECFYLGALSLPFVFSYPLFKRFTYYPQVMISINFSWGCLLGFPAVLAPLNYMAAVPLFLSNFLWSMIYDTIYAHQDKQYDIKAGIKLTALAWGDKTKPIIYGLYAAQLVSFLGAGYMNAMGPLFYVGAAWGFQRLLSQIRAVDLDSPKSCWAFFTGNIKTGWILWVGILLDYLVKIGNFF